MEKFIINVGREVWRTELNNNIVMNTRITLSDRNKEVLDDYESHEEPTEPDELADYMNALGKLIAVSTHQDKYDVNELLKMNGVARELRDGEKTVEEAKTWIDEEFEPAT